MSRIVFTWELGGGYGHILGLLPQARELRKRGHDVVFVLRDLFYAETILGDEGFSYFQAPVWLHPPNNLSDAASYAEILFRFGYLDKTKLLGMVKAWKELFAILKPDLILMDHSPTALLATHYSDIPRALIGSGFCSPPKISPLPSMRPWQDIPEKRLSDSERKVLTTINYVLESAGDKPMTRLSALFDIDEDFLATFPELDHYQNRGTAKYIGPRFNQDNGDTPEWPNTGNPKIFAYLKPGYKNFEKIIKSFRNSPYQFLIHAPNLPQKMAQDLGAENIIFSEKLVQLRYAARQCDAAICHAGHGTVASILLAGKPLLLLPSQLEQLLVAGAVTRFGASLLVLPSDPNVNHLELLGKLIETPQYGKKAKSFAEKYIKFNEKEQFEYIVNRCEELLNHTIEMTDMHLSYIDRT